MKCKNHTTCKGQAQEGKKLCWECEQVEGVSEKAEDRSLYFGMAYIDKHAEGQAEYEHKQKGKK